MPVAPTNTLWSDAVRVPVLEWNDSGGSHSVVIQKKAFLGAGADAEVQVRDPLVSRVHAELEPREGGVFVRDLESRNGTFVDGVSVRSAVVAFGHHLRVGGTELRVTAMESTRISKSDVWPEARFQRLVGGSRPMRELYANLARVAMSDGAVFIQGETGTGKELVARSLHEASPRRNGPLVVVDCAALPENLLDAELFGHTKGAFTGAVSARAGAIEAADGGTVFLDEIGELPISMQPKLLRVLEQRTVRRIGESSHRAVDVRFVSATHRDLLAMVGQGRFREDLYFRLAVLPVNVPSVRDRREDIEGLVEHFVAQSGGGSLPPALIEEITRRPWRGNVRELRNFVERARALGAEGALALAGPASSASSMDPRTMPPPPPSFHDLPRPYARPTPTSDFSGREAPWRDRERASFRDLDRADASQRDLHGTGEFRAVTDPWSARDPYASYPDVSPGSVPPSAPIPSDLLGRGYGRVSGATANASWEALDQEGMPNSESPPTVPGIEPDRFASAPRDAGPNDAIYRQDFKSFRDQWIQVGEREYLRRLLERHQRNVVAAAKEADVDRTHIYRLMRKHGL